MATAAQTWVHPDPEAQRALSDRDEAVLRFERQWWKHGGAKDEAIRELFSMNGTQYYQALNAIIDLPAALEHDPMLVKRLRRLRTARHRDRTTRH